MTSERFTQARIFIIDDESTNLKLLSKILTTQGYRNLLLLQDPREVLPNYQDNRADLILLDVNMPYMDGYEVIEQLKGLHDPLLPPIVILTAQHGRDYLLKALAAGASDFVSKPFDRTELLMRVCNLLDAQLAHRLLHDQKAVLEDMVRVRTHDLNQTRLQVVQRLGRAAEYRDNETGLHIIRMSQFSALLAKSIGWDTDACDLILHASPMHDVGKIGIPDAILLKPGAFEPHEWEIMKRHTTIGAAILEGGDSELMQLAHTIALTHHEKWDGSGYPYGLAGADIPMSGRIVAIADVFDALTSARPYKKSWPIDEAVAFILEQSGRHFDPELVQHFEKRLPEILEIRERYLEPETPAPAAH